MNTSTVLAKVGEEVAALQATAAAAAGGEEEGAGLSELIKPQKESEAVLLQVWTPAVKSNAPGELPACLLPPTICFYTNCNFIQLLYHTGLAALKGHVLPPPAPVLNLLYAIGCLAGFGPADLQNVCGDPDWTTIQTVCSV